MSNQGIRDSGWVSDHPLFRVGTFLFPTANTQGDYQAQGCYNPVVDSMALQYRSDELEKHEQAHRIFAIGVSGFDFMRELAGISYTLLLTLLDVVNACGVASKNGGQLRGRRLETLRMVGDPSGEGWVRVIVERLKSVEDIFDMYYRGLLPVAEIAAIDFIPGQRWHGDPERNVVGKRTKDKLISDVANSIPADFGGYYVQYGSLEWAFRSLWEAYTSIEDADTAAELLRLVMSSVIQPDDQDDPKNFVVGDTLRCIFDLVPSARQPGALARFRTAREAADRGTSIVLKSISASALDSLTDLVSKNHIMASRLTEAVKGVSSQQHGTVHIGSAPESSLFAPGELGKLPVSSEDKPRYSDSLLTFWVDVDGRLAVLVNAGHEMVFAQGQLRPKAPDLGEHWYREVVSLETLRQAVKTGKPVLCPFLNCEGAICDSCCTIRRLFVWLQDNTELMAEGATCRL